jgi:hypothetical protein
MADRRVTINAGTAIDTKGGGNSSTFNGVI